MAWLDPAPQWKPDDDKGHQASGSMNGVAAINGFSARVFSKTV
jgi:hypothetical protein